MEILGVSDFYYDSATALINGGEIIAVTPISSFTKTMVIDLKADEPKWRSQEYCGNNTGRKWMSINKGIFCAPNPQAERYT